MKTFNVTVECETGEQFAHALLLAYQTASAIPEAFDALTVDESASVEQPDELAVLIYRSA